MQRPLVWLLLVPILLYRKLVSPLVPARCRFYPSCSAYGVEALRKYGPFVGLYRTVGRVLRCHPWNPGGYDPP
ncbi:MAG: membrane protein insertion efficiency factor YidD [bacterium]